MNLRKSLLAASIAAIPLMAAVPAIAANSMMASPKAQSSAQENADLIGKLMAQRGQHGLVASDHGFAVASEHPGVVGTKIHRVNHTFKNVRIWHSESVVVTNDAGSIVSESISERRQGLGQGQSFAGKAGVNFDVNPTISGKQATDLVVNKLAPNGTHIVAPKAELIIYPVMKSVRIASAVNKAEAALNALDLVDVLDHYELAYFVQTRMTKDGRPNLNDTIVSATDGHVIKQWSAMHTVVGTGNSQYNGVVPIQTTLSGSTYKMLDSTRGIGGTFGGAAIVDANHSSPNAPSNTGIYTNSTNTWGDGTQYNGGSDTNANGQTAAVNALWGLMNTYDMLKNTLGWQSLDGNNTATYIAAHVSTNYDNAFYTDTCKCMYIGDGSTFTSLGSIDVIGHEMSHGVTAATSNLTYSGESGGLNESNSDIGGEMTEAYARNGGTGTVIPAGNDWKMGVEISKTGTPLRWMYKPSKDGSSPDAWSSTVGNLNVHYSSGPNNRMFYFLSQGSSSSSTSDYYSAYLTKSPLAMTGIGNDKAYRIWFKASTTKFTASTNYADARSKVLLAAQELYGVGSNEAIAVQRAYAAINVGSDIDETGGTPGAVTITSPASITVAAGSTASFSVSASSGTAPYSYQWYRNGVLISGATSATYSFTAQSTDNGAVFKATVTDSATTPTTATSGNATLTVTTGGTATETMVNGGFESGTSPWTGNTGDIGTWSGEPAATGTRNAWMGGNGSAITETLSQTVSIPSTATSATLTFALHIDTAESGSTAYDKLTVKVKNTAGTVLQTLATYSNVNAASGYQTRTFDLSAYKGQTVQVSFSETEDSSLQTSFVLDNVSLMVK